MNTATANPLLSENLRLWLAAQGFSDDDPHSSIENATTPLMRASRLGDTAIVAELLAAGADVNISNQDGNAALWLACFSNNAALIDLLIAHGANIDHQNDNGATCLMYCASAGKAQITALLLAAGANREIKSLDDYTALDMAGSLECLNLLRPPRHA